MSSRSPADVTFRINYFLCQQHKYCPAPSTVTPIGVVKVASFPCHQSAVVRQLDLPSAHYPIVTTGVIFRIVSFTQVHNIEIIGAVHSYARGKIKTVHCCSYHPVMPHMPTDPAIVSPPNSCQRELQIGMSRCRNLHEQIFGNVHSYAEGKIKTRSAVRPSALTMIPGNSGNSAHYPIGPNLLKLLNCASFRYPPQRRFRWRPLYADR